MNVEREARQYANYLQSVGQYATDHNGQPHNAPGDKHSDLSVTESVITAGR